MVSCRLHHFLCLNFVCFHVSFWTSSRLISPIWMGMNWLTPVTAAKGKTLRNPKHILRNILGSGNEYGTVTTNVTLVCYSTLFSLQVWVTGCHIESNDTHKPIFAKRVQCELRHQMASNVVGELLLLRQIWCYHDDVIKWKSVSRNWPFVWITVEFLSQSPATLSFDVFFA